MHCGPNAADVVYVMTLEAVPLDDYNQKVKISNQQCVSFVKFEEKKK